MMPVEAWAVWIGLFVVLELAAVYMGGGTLTQYVRRFFSIRGERLRWRLPRWALLVLVAWIVVHFYRVFR